MSNKYTTGEIAKLCGVSVRTVQYYDSRKILIPDEVSDGGRRVYSEANLQKLKIICFLRSIDLSINNIAELFQDKNSKEIISMLFMQREETLQAEIKERQEKLSTLEGLMRQVKNLEDFSVETIGDMAKIMDSKKKLRKIHMKLFAGGILMDFIQILLLVLGIMRGIWWPFGVGICIVFVIGVLMAKFYFQHVAYICPNCHEVFQPSFKEAFFARHTPATRKLTCTSCGHKGFCVEVAKK